MKMQNSLLLIGAFNFMVSSVNGIENSATNTEMSFSDIRKTNSNSTLPPTSPAITNRTLEVASQLVTTGFKSISNESMDFLVIENVSHEFEDIAFANAYLSVPLIRIPSVTGLFTSLTFAGIIPKDLDSNTGKWLKSSRYFTIETGQVLMLTEYDYLTANIFTSFPKELTNAKVGGFDAMLMRLKDDTGKIYTRIFWGSTLKMYGLYFTGNTKGEGNQNELTKLANSLQSMEK